MYGKTKNFFACAFVGFLIICIGRNFFPVHSSPYPSVVSKSASPSFSYKTKHSNGTVGAFSEKIPAVRQVTSVPKSSQKFMTRTLSLILKPNSAKLFRKSARERVVGIAHARHLKNVEITNLGLGMWKVQYAYTKNTATNKAFMSDLEQTHLLQWVEMDKPLAQSTMSISHKSLETELAVERKQGNVPSSRSLTQPDAPWDLDRIDQVNGLDGHYTYDSTGKGVTAYILDTGISVHAEFQGRSKYAAWTHSDGETWHDCNGHGTAVASQVGGATAGVAKDVTIVSVKIKGRTWNSSCAGDTSDLVTAINWVLGDAKPGQLSVVNISQGSSDDPAVDLAIQRLLEKNISVIAAAGNASQDACSTSPADITGVIAVAASDKYDMPADFTNFGACTDIFAPGVDNYLANYQCSWCYETASGTSFASPIVAGIVARILESFPEFTPLDVKDYLLSNANYNSDLEVTPDTPGLLAYAPPHMGKMTEPGAASVTSVLAGNRQVTVSFTAPDNDGGAVITNYEYSVDAGLLWTAASPDQTSSPLAIKGLTNGMSYQVAVRAVNAAGAGSASNVMRVTLPKSMQVISFSQPKPIILGRADMKLIGSTTAHGLHVVWTVASRSKKVCSVTHGKLHVKKTGLCSVMASQPGNSRYKSAVPIIRAVVIKKA